MMKRNIYLYSNGELKRKDNTLRFVSIDGTNKDLPIERINEIYIFGELNFNKSLLSFLSQKAIIVHLFNYYGYYMSTIYPREANISGKLLVKQVESYTNQSKRLEIAKEIIRGSTHNIYRNLRYYNGRGKDLEHELKSISKLIEFIERQNNVNELMGIEGAITRKYYESWTKIINQDLEFKKRVKRPPDNIVNTMISFINSLVYSTVLSELYKTSLNPTISYLHEPGERRFSLALDLAEIFKPILSHRLIFSLLNKSQINERHFMQEVNFLHLKEKGSRVIVQEFDKRLSRTIKIKELNREVSYKYLIRLEAYKLIKHLYEEKKYSSFKMWW